MGRKIGLITTFLLVLSFLLPLAATSTSAIAQTPATPTVTSLVPNTGMQGQTLTGVVINGTNLTGATAVTFSGTGFGAYEVIGE